MSAKKLWYTAPPTEYISGLPIGTGRLAAMILGTSDPERVALNHEWFWRGPNRMRDVEVQNHLLPEVRELLLAGKYAEGTLAGGEAFGGPEHKEGVKRVDSYQPAGDLHFELDCGDIDAGSYRRELDLSTGRITVQYDAASGHVRREYLADLADDLILVRITAEGPIGGTFWLARVQDDGCRLRFDTRPEKLVMDGQIHQGLSFRVEADVRISGGQATVRGDRVVITGADEILIALNVGTGARGQAPAVECRGQSLPDEPWENLQSASQEVLDRFCNTLSLTVDVPDSSDPTDVRMAAAREGTQDPTLPLLYFNYGRYLLVAGTATAELPPNLQGKWNQDIQAPWDADYHHDINLQMAFWPAEPGALQYTFEALMQHIERMVPHGRKAARDLYDCDGVFIPITTDAWGRCTPESKGWAVWIAAAAWLGQHVWWHWEFGRDKTFLAERAYPYFREVAAFYESYLIEDDAGQLQIVPSQSPENRFECGGNHPVTLCVSSAMDVQLCRAALEFAADSADVLGIDASDAARWRATVARLPGLKIGEHGELLEWNFQAEELEPGHRHISHLWALFPGDQICPTRTPELWQAARVSLDRRLAAGGGHTGWSRSWVACCFARFGEGDVAWEHLIDLIAQQATDSLLDLHPPRIFQIDGNFGGTAAVIEMLLQSYHEELHFLPALPSTWPSGRVTGLRARGGYTVDIEWKDAALVEARVTASKDGPCTVLVPDGARYAVSTTSGEAVQTEGSDGHIRFSLRAGSMCRVAPAK